MPDAQKRTEIQVQVQFLGEPRLLTRFGRSIGPLPKKAWALLAYLYQASPRAVRREEVATLLWPDSNEASGRASLRTLLAGLKRPLAVAGLDSPQATKDTVGLAWPSDAVDLGRVETALAKGADDLQDVLIRYHRGDFLARLGIRSGAFEEWLLVERQHQKHRITDALRALLKAQSKAERKISVAETLLRFDPTAEVAYRALMQAHLELGAGDLALGAFKRCQEAMQRELDVSPSFATRLLASDIRAKATGQPSPAQVSESRAVLVEARPVLVGDIAEDLPARYMMEAQTAFADLFAATLTQQGGTLVGDGTVRWIGVFDAGDAPRQVASALRVAQVMAETTFGVDADASLQAALAIGVGNLVVRRQPGQVAAAGQALLEIGAAVMDAGAQDIKIHSALRSDLPKNVALQDGASVFLRKL